MGVPGIGQLRITPHEDHKYQLTLNNNTILEQLHSIYKDTATLSHDEVTDKFKLEWGAGNARATQGMVGAADINGNGGYISFILDYEDDDERDSMKELLKQMIQ